MPNPDAVVVIVGSYPFTSNWVQENIPAVLYASHAGPELGNAVADVLYGDYARAGRLNMTWVQSAVNWPTSRITISFNPVGHINILKVMYVPFGHGLTYATFKYSNLNLAQLKWVQRATLR